MVSNLDASMAESRPRRTQTSTGWAMSTQGEFCHLSIFTNSFSRIPFLFSFLPFRIPSRHFPTFPILGDTYFQTYCPRHFSKSKCKSILHFGDKYVTLQLSSFVVKMSIYRTADEMDNLLVGEGNRIVVGSSNVRHCKSAKRVWWLKRLHKGIRQRQLEGCRANALSVDRTSLPRLVTTKYR